MAHSSAGSGKVVPETITLDTVSVRFRLYCRQGQVCHHTTHTATQEGLRVHKAAAETEEITDLVMTHVEPTPETLPSPGDLFDPHRDIVLVPVPG